MSEHNPRPLAELIDPGWARALAPVEGRVHELGAMLAAEVEAGRGYLPAGTDVLRAFTYPFEKVKVLIVGAGSVSDAGARDGLVLFGAPRGWRCPSRSSTSSAS